MTRRISDLPTRLIVTVPLAPAANRVGARATVALAGPAGRGAGVWMVLVIVIVAPEPQPPTTLATMTASTTVTRPAGHQLDLIGLIERQDKDGRCAQRVTAVL
jgi:hypothetical protein